MNLVKKFKDQWNKNKHKLEDYFRKTPLREYLTSEHILEKLLQIVIHESNENEIIEGFEGERNCEYIFMINVYRKDQYRYSGYIFTYMYTPPSPFYCSASVSNRYENDNLPTEKDIEMLMDTALNFVKRMKFVRSDK